MTIKNNSIVSRLPRTVWEQGALRSGEDQVVTECAVALVYNGISHVVMMTTPIDLEDFALGFSLSEGILHSANQLLDFEEITTDGNIELCLSIPSGLFAALKKRRRNLVGRTGCGLCGAESLAQAIRIPNKVTSQVAISHSSIQRAVLSLEDAQNVQKVTGAVHAAAWFDKEGNLLLVREDVGRHNALDKLLGAYHKAGLSSGGFLLVTSRASYEMVTKAASANIAILVAFSGPTSMAINLANSCNLTLIGFARPQRHVVYTYPERLS